MPSNGNDRDSSSQCLLICPVGPLDDALLDTLARRIEALSGLTCRICGGLDLPRKAFHKDRLQYDSRIVLTHLMSARPACLRLIAITRADLYIPVLQYVFGLAQMEGPCTLISLHRLCPRFYDHPEDPELLMERALKTVMHELGHSFGLIHCRDRRCVMYSSVRVGDTDIKTMNFCPTCYELFRWHLNQCLTCPSP